MAGLSAFVSTIQPWHWWTLGALLLAIEIASTTFYLLWPGIAALLVGAIAYLYPGLDGRLAIALFAGLAIVSTVVWKRSAWGVSNPTQVLNTARGLTYRGRHVVALEDFSAHGGAVVVDDTRWHAIAADGSIPRKGETLEVVDADGATLKVKGVYRSPE